jgi:hypothetical protein
MPQSGFDIPWVNALENAIGNVIAPLILESGIFIAGQQVKSQVTIWEIHQGISM